VQGRDAERKHRGMGRARGGFGVSEKNRCEEGGSRKEEWGAKGGGRLVPSDLSG